MVISKVFSLFKNKGLHAVLHKAAGKLCKKITTKEDAVTNIPLPEFFYIETSPENNPEIRTLRVKDGCDTALEVPFQFNLHVNSKKVAAIIHIYYPDLSEEIMNYLGNIPCRTDLYISTDTKDKKLQIEQCFSHYNNGTVKVEIFENRGRDIAPMIVGFKEVFERYEFFIHLHSKKSPHSNEGLVDWREYLFENLLGSSQIVMSHLYLLEHKNVGISFAQHFIPLRININWGYDYTLVKNLLKQAGITMNSKQLLEFPSGSMFWGRTDAIRPLLNLDISFADFPEEAGQIDGTLAHAIERSFLYICEAAHFQWAKVARHDYYPLKNTVITVDSKEVLDKAISRVYRPLFNTYLRRSSRIFAKVPEYVHYNTYPSSCIRPRLNLMVPTVNAKETFGGIATAFKVYNALKEHLNERFDYRIIVDIGLVSEESKQLFSDYMFMSNVIDDSCPMQLVETRESKELHLRRNDFFIATAWWTAASAFWLLEDQQRFFGHAHRLIYLIQDYESNFNAWSAQWIFAENTYKQPERTIAIINAEELALFMEQRYRFSSTYYLPYTMNEAIREKLISTPRKRQILFYGRPTVERNLFDVIVDGLALWQQRNPLTCKLWHIYSLGESYEATYVDHIDHVSIVGKASLDDYAAFLSESMIGISLMVSPHPSYPPLEMAYAGMKVITNGYDGKDLALRSENILSLNTLSSEALADAIELLCDAIEHNGFDTQKGVLSAPEVDMAPFNAKNFCELLWS